MATDNFGGVVHGVANPARGASIVSKSDTVDLSQVGLGLWIGAGGSLKVTMADGGSAQFLNVPVGQLNIRVSRVWETGTGASDILNLY